MLGSMSRKRAVKVISIGLSIYMTFVPIVVQADEVRDEATAYVVQAVEESKITDSQTKFENMEIVAGVDTSDENISVDTSVLVEDAVNLIENEAIKEATDAIVNVDMSNVDAALDKVTELISDTLTDETVADQIEATADTLISIYDTQADAAFNALKVISEEMDAVSVLADGSVNIDWNAATDEVTRLYEIYQAALASKEDAQIAKDEVVEKETAMTNKIDELNGGAINNNREVSEVISNSKQSKNNTINEIIACVAEQHAKDIAAKYTLDQKVSGSSDIYRFYINIVEGEVAYGCLTYYDSESKTILRKNFKISSDNIDYDYVPKDEWVKGNANCKNIVFGNGGNYIAAYVDNASAYIKGGKTFDGSIVSNLMRENVDLNNAIDARNQACIDLEEINRAVEKAEEELQDAADKANDALKAYKEAVKMYKEAAALDGEVKNNKVEKAKLEYVKAEVEIWRKQQVLEQIKNTINNADTSTDVVRDEVHENIENVINRIAGSLDVEPEAVEVMVAQIIIDDKTNNNEANSSDDVPVLDVSRNEETVVSEEEVVEPIENVMPIAQEMVVENASNALNDEQELVIIDDEEVPVANPNENPRYSRNLWLSFVIVLACVTFLMYIVIKRKQEEN